MSTGEHDLGAAVKDVQVRRILNSVLGQRFGAMFDSPRRSMGGQPIQDGRFHTPIAHTIDE